MLVQEEEYFRIGFESTNQEATQNQAGGRKKVGGGIRGTGRRVFERKTEEEETESWTSSRTPRRVEVAYRQDSRRSDRPRYRSDTSRTESSIFARSSER